MFIIYTEHNTEDNHVFIKICRDFKMSIWIKTMVSNILKSQWSLRYLTGLILEKRVEELLILLQQRKKFQKSPKKKLQLQMFITKKPTQSPDFWKQNSEKLYIVLLKLVSTLCFLLFRSNIGSSASPRFQVDIMTRHCYILGLAVY